jgi:lipid-binding SYLF domain-containing protein
MRPSLLFAATLFSAVTVTTGVPLSHRSDLGPDVQTTIATFKKNDPSMHRFFENSAGYAVFPTVTKAAIGIGGAHGDGQLVVHGHPIGKTGVSQVSIGAQLGAQGYSEIIFFETDAALSSFKNGNFSLEARASAVAVTSGASADAKFSNGVAIFTATKGGLMYEASVGGQKFTYEAYGSTASN